MRHGSGRRLIRAGPLDHRTENPRVGGSIPPLATTPLQIFDTSRCTKRSRLGGNDRVRQFGVETVNLF
jgi:hypothetical protein